MNLNYSFIGGHMVRDPEMSFTTNETAITNFAVAVNYKRGDNEHTSFIECTAFGKLAEIIAKYFTKGKPIIVIGRIQQDRWKTDEGYNRSKIKIIVNEFKFVGSPNNNSNNQNNNRSYNNSSNEDDIFGNSSNEDDIFGG